MRLTIDSIRGFLKRAALRTHRPNRTTIEAMKEANDVASLKRHDSFRDLREGI